MLLWCFPHLSQCQLGLAPAAPAILEGEALQLMDLPKATTEDCLLFVPLRTLLVTAVENG